jgi:hypothetical protein
MFSPVVMVMAGRAGYGEALKGSALWRVAERSEIGADRQVGGHAGYISGVQTEVGTCPVLWDAWKMGLLRRFDPSGF